MHTRITNYESDLMAFIFDAVFNHRPMYELGQLGKVHDLSGGIPSGQAVAETPARR